MKILKLTTIAMGLFIASVTNVMGETMPPPSQEGENPEMSAAKENFMAQKVSFFTNALNLTPQEAQVFWPLYNEFWAKRVEARKDFMSILKRVKSSKENKETDWEKLSDEFVLNLTKESDLMKEYYQKFKEILPTEKALKIFDTEEMFKQSLFNNYKKRKAADRP